MPTGRTALMALLAGAALAVAPPARGQEPGSADAILAGLPEELVAGLLERGWLVLQEVDVERAGLTGGYILAYVLFEAPRDAVWTLLAQTERQREFRPELRGLERIRELPDGVLDEHRIRVMLFKVVYRLRYRLDEAAQRIQWKLDPEFDNDLDRVEGFWELHAMSDGRTLARFGTVVDVGAALPNSLQDMVTRSRVPKTLEACRDWVDAGGTERP